VEQRDMADLEAGRFRPGIGFTTVGDLWQMVRRHFADQSVARERAIEFDPSAEHVTLCTDPVLLRRALVNMVKNALEATPRRGKVRVWCEADEQIASFHVWNERAMSPEVALRVFQRYFSTKSGRGHGLGTYGMKLIAERYLRGHVCFTSTLEDGTVFHLDIPREYPHDTELRAPASGMA
jgi:signal transduction histidine kinase